ncbi:transmembrane protein [Cyclospora cayetanensis]|uniref:Transmembrane protein n=1 Tax=Cyclospora cayetanensis TaxID=88456 RepID=A0A1D3D157_9EIME|nr:transmembrane protein [Cyclospora cayetanensis]
MHVDSPEGPRIGVITASMVSVAPPQSVSADAPCMDADDEEPRDSALGFPFSSPQTASSVGGSAAAASPASAPPVVRLVGGPSDGGASMVKHLEVSGGSRRRLAAAPGGKAPGPSLRTEAWLDTFFELRGSLHLAEDGKAFVELVRRLATEAEVPLVFTDSQLDVEAQFALGRLFLPKMQLDHELPMAGMGVVEAVEVSSFSLLGEKAGGWLFASTAVLPARVPATVALGAVSMYLSFEGLPLGFLATQSLVVREGLNDVFVVGLLRPEGLRSEVLETLSRFFSAAVASPSRASSGRPHMQLTLSTEQQGAAMEMLRTYMTQPPPASPSSFSSSAASPEARGASTGAPAKWLRAAMEGLTLQLPVPSLGDVSSRVQGVDMEALHINWPLVSDYTVPLMGLSLLRLSNPLGPRVPMHLRHLSLEAKVAALVEAEAPLVPTPGGPLVPLTGAPSAAPKILVPLGAMRAELTDLTCKAVGSGASNALQEGHPLLGPIGDLPAVTEDAGMIEIRAPLQTAIEITEGSLGPHNFGMFAAAFVEQQTVRLEFMGTADCLVETPFGVVKVSQVELHNAMDIPGLGGLHNITYADFKVLGIGDVEAHLSRATASEEEEEEAPEEPQQNAASDATASTVQGILMDLTAACGQPRLPSKKAQIA